MKTEDKIELTAEYLHILWSRWFRYQLIHQWNPLNLCRWLRQSRTSYSELSEKDKNKDRKLAIDLLRYEPSFRSELNERKNYYK